MPYVTLKYRVRLQVVLCVQGEYEKLSILVGWGTDKWIPLAALSRLHLMTHDISSNYYRPDVQSYMYRNYHETIRTPSIAEVAIAAIDALCRVRSEGFRLKISQIITLTDCFSLKPSIGPRKQPYPIYIFQFRKVIISS
jgi:hypothetical protein